MKENMIKVRYLGTKGIYVPRLRNRRGSLTLPLKNAFTKQLLPKEDQVFEIHAQDLACLQRCWGKKAFEIVPTLKDKITKTTQSKTEKEEVNDDV